VRRLAIAFGIGLGVGLLITTLRVVLRARKGLPTVLGPSAGHPGANGSGPGTDGDGLAGLIAQPVDTFMALAERVRAAVTEGAAAMKETESELRSKVLEPGS
jgi:hypothetical protein